MENSIDTVTDEQKHWHTTYGPAVIDWVTAEMANADSGHGIEHVRRVVENAQTLGKHEGGNPNIYLPAAWLHDCVAVAKNSPQRKQASRLAAQHAVNFLNSICYPEQFIAPIAHCIVAHSFSANIPCETIEAKIVQDADRMEAVGAIGLARCLMTGGSMNQRLYHPENPFPTSREPADTEQSVDHFFAKLLGLYKTMQTHAGREVAKDRTRFLIEFLKQLSVEIGSNPRELEAAIAAKCDL